MFLIPLLIPMSVKMQTRGEARVTELEFSVAFDDTAAEVHRLLGCGAGTSQVLLIH